MVVASILTDISHWITGTIGDYGLYAIFLLMLVDAVLPAASELVMVYAGALAAGAFSSQTVTLFGYEISEGFWAFVAVVLAGTIGYTVGSIIGWAIGDYAGRPYLERHGRWLHLDKAKLERADRWFERWEDWAVFLGRLTPVVRSFISVPAGVFRAPFGRYTALTFAGSTIWCLLFAGVGYWLGSNWERFHDAFRYVDYLVIALVVIVVALVVWRVLRRRRAGGGEPAPGYTHEPDR